MTREAYSTPNFLDACNTVCSKLCCNKRTQSSQKRLLNTVIIVLDAEGADEELIGKYREQCDAVSTAYDTFLETREKTAKEKNAWVTLKQLRDIMNTKRLIVNRSKLHKKKTAELSNSEWQELQQYLVCGLYLLDQP